MMGSLKGSKRVLWLQWTIAVILGVGVGGFLGKSGDTLGLEAVTLIALLQWLVLRQWIKDFTVWWIFLTLAGWLIYQILEYTPILLYLAGATNFLRGFSDPMSAMAGFNAILGLLIGISQWLILRRSDRFRQAAWWILANCLALGVASFFSFYVFISARSSLGLRNATQMWLSTIASLVIQGVVVGSITGIVLTRILKPKPDLVASTS